MEVSILPGSNITVTPGTKGKIYFIDDYDNTESIIADIEVLDSLNNGVVHAKVLGRSPSIQITRGRYVRFWSPAQIADTTAPDGSVSINNGSSYTNTTSVTLTLSAADNVRVIGYYISTNPNPPSAIASDWKPVASSKNYSENISHTLNSGDGNKTVYVWYKDASGNISIAANNSIILDTTAPTITITSPTSDSTYTTKTSPISIGGMAWDSSGIRSVRWSNSKGDSWPVNGTTNWSIPGINLPAGNNSITVTATDGAGNMSEDTIRIDTASSSWQKAAASATYEDKRK